MHHELRLTASNPSFPELAQVVDASSLPGPWAVSWVNPPTLTCTCDSNAPGHLAALGLTGTGAGREAGGYWTAALAGKVPSSPCRI